MKNLQLISIVAAAVMTVAGCSKDGGGFKNAWYAEKLYTAADDGPSITSPKCINTSIYTTK